MTAQTTQIRGLKSGNIAVLAPWHAQLIAACRERQGEWMELTIDGQKTKGWRLDRAHEAYMTSLLAELFPPQEQLVYRVYRVAHQGSSTAPQVDGYDLVTFGRDAYGWKKFNRGEPFKIIHVMEDNLQTGGSARYPRLSGSCLVAVKCRPQAEATWPGGTVDLVESSGGTPDQVAALRTQIRDRLGGQPLRSISLTEPGHLVITSGAGTGGAGTGGAATSIYPGEWLTDICQLFM
jgi:hypothetical protein